MIIDYGNDIITPSSGTLTIGSGSNSFIGLPAVTVTPPVPPSGVINIFCSSRASYNTLSFENTFNTQAMLQSGMGDKRIAVLGPSSGTTIFQHGTAISTTGTIANPTPTTGNLKSSIRGFTMTTANAAGNVAGYFPSILEVWMGNGAQNFSGGYYYSCTFGLNTIGTGNYAFVGLVDSVSAPTSADPTTATTPGKIGMAIDLNSGNWQLVHNVTGTAPTLTDLGTSIPVNATALYRLELYTTPNGNTVFYRVTPSSAGGLTVSGSITTNMPANTTFLGMSAWIGNHATAGTLAMFVARTYLEADF